MSIDSGLLQRALQRLEDDRRLREAELEARRDRLYRLDPQLGNIDSELRLTVLELIAGSFGGGDADFSAEAVRERNLTLQEEYSRRIAELGYPADWLDDKPACEKCGDHGFVDGRMCSCLMELYRAEQLFELSRALNIGEESFDAFDLGYYSDDARGGMSERDHMELIYETCLNYARRFGASRDSLLMTGGTGLGKTFLSTCIARVVSEAGFFVVYDTAVNIFNAFEGEKFSRSSSETEDFAELTRRYLSCDLLIIDDLGTEMMTSFVSSAVYTLINSRMTAGRATIINTNLSLEDMRRRYSPQTMSRIEGAFRILVFRGRDIRLQKKQRGL